MITNTVHLQFANSDDGKTLIAYDAEAVQRMEDRIANNLASIVDGWIEDAAELAA
jgi:hypothetical protein